MSIIFTWLMVIDDNWTQNNSGHKGLTEDVFMCLFIPNPSVLLYTHSRLLRAVPGVTRDNIAAKVSSL